MKRPLIIADVGSAVGPEERWHGLGGCAHFLTFDPVSRPESLPGLKITNFPVGLSSHTGKAQLNLTRDPDASTLCPVNHEALADFPVGPMLEVTGTVEVEVSTLDRVLESQPNLRPDFLKVDVEGADLEVLRGAAHSLRTTVLALRVEVSFIERHRGAPVFAETDEFLRNEGFRLMHLVREHWFRSNLVRGFNTQPQLAWGDAVYFLPRQAMLNRLISEPDADRDALLTKIVTVCLAHNAHDYAIEIIGAARTARLVGERYAKELVTAVESSVESSLWWILWYLFGVVFAVALFLPTLPFRETREQARHYPKRRAGQFFRLLARRISRSGPDNCCNYEA